MPNWAYNTVYFTGDAEKLEALKEQVGAPTQIPGVQYVHGEDGKVLLDADNNVVKENTTHDDENPVFSFWNIVRPNPEEYEEYRDQGWYGWNNAHWGTKWDAGDVEVIEESGTGWAIQFRTAWAPPQEVLVALSEQHPDVSIRNEWYEEQGFGAHQEYSGGIHWLDKEWDIPSSHAEYIENLTEEDCPCNFGYDDDELPFDDCPRSKNPTQIAVEELEKVSELI